VAHYLVLERLKFSDDFSFVIASRGGKKRGDPQELALPASIVLASDIQTQR
jgi:hypothetical protein